MQVCDRPGREDFLQNHLTRFIRLLPNLVTLFINCAFDRQSAGWIISIIQGGVPDRASIVINNPGNDLLLACSRAMNVDKVLVLHVLVSLIWRPCLSNTEAFQRPVER